MAQRKAKYFPYLCKCMSFKHHGKNLTEYSPCTTPLFAEAELVNVTPPDDIVKYMSFSAYGTATLQVQTIGQQTGGLILLSLQRRPLATTCQTPALGTTRLVMETQQGQDWYSISLQI